MAPRYQHYVPTAILRPAMEYGYPVVALCGHTWIPEGYRPDLALCPDCERALDPEHDGSEGAQ